MSIILVTGAGSGIGLATALHFAHKGHDVYAGVRSLATAGELTQVLEKESLSVTPVVIDVDDATSVERGVQEVIERSGRVDVLINNAGIGGGGPIEDVPLDWVKTLFETNYFGAVRMIKAVLPGMRERRSGTIVNISSLGGLVAIAGHGHYCAVKHALEAMSEALAQEVLAFDIRVAIVEPGMVATPIFGKARRFADLSSPYIEHVRRLLGFYQKQSPFAAQPVDVAEVIHQAVITTTPKLRWLVGEDVKLLAAGRRRLSDEEYIAAAAPLSLDQYLERMRRTYGFDWK